jgi:hypothetical protein
MDSRTRQILNAIQSVPDADTLTDAQLVDAITKVTEVPNSKQWRYSDFVDLFTEPVAVAALELMPKAFMAYVAEGIDFSDETTRARFGPGGDIRERLGNDALADQLLSLGSKQVSVWSQKGEGTAPIETEVAAVRLGELRRHQYLQRVANAYNAAHERISEGVVPDESEIDAIMGGW